MSFSRWWTETTAAVSDHVPLPLALLLLVLASALAAAAWYAFPAWVPRRLPRLPRWRPARPARRRATATAPPPAAHTPQPTVTRDGILAVADRLAAEGRYDEAIRERLRAMLHELTDRHVVPIRPGMTVTEVVAVAAANRPPAGPPLAAAASIFSEVWYAQRPATAQHDHRMRDHADRLRHLLAADPAPDQRPAATAASGDPAPTTAEGPRGPSGTVAP
ncbi:DUF4129 domain-containing protein [Micromonospora sp. WMMD1082]|uniref:DUF4129 domain-containing protein n=1 Tax=Micromonospora sp. WMMD1082 TaxID=3016104 RepID=UPI00241620E7|nr:DUF4129 domain-containing protein [Micromonospora sp. WMMD1082]MDG4793169.1 DUF4129 domain-containing protein [Micromonospora sp. WMMD1082]